MKRLPKRQVSWEHVDSLRRFWGPSFDRVSSPMKRLLKRHVSWEHADSLRRFWKHIERFQEEATMGTSRHRWGRVSQDASNDLPMGLCRAQEVSRDS